MGEIKIYINQDTFSNIAGTWDKRQSIIIGCIALIGADIQKNIKFTILLNTMQDLLIPYRTGRKWGFSLTDKTIVIDCIYDRVGRFSEGLAWVMLNGKYGYINQTGEIIIPIKFRAASNFSSGMASVGVMIGERLVGYNAQNNKKILYKEIKFGYINHLGQVVIPFQFDYARDFNNGLAIVNRGMKYQYPYGWEDEGKWGLIDSNGIPILGCEYHEIISSGAYFILRKYKWCEIYNAETNSILPVKFSKIMPLAEGFFAVGQYVKMVTTHPIHNGQKCVSINPIYRCGFINTLGEIVIPLIYDSTIGFSEGLALVLVDGKYGYINKDGEWVIQPIYDNATSFSENVAIVKNESRWEIINKKGECLNLVDCAEHHDIVGEFSNGLAPIITVYYDKEGCPDEYILGFINQSGDFAINFKYDFDYDNPDRYKFINSIQFVAIKDKDQHDIFNGVGYIDLTGEQFWADDYF